MDEEKKSGVSRGVANGMLGAIIFMVIMILMLFISHSVADDPKEEHCAFMTFDNECNTTVNATIYVMTEGNWDKIYFTIYDQETIEISWSGDLYEVLVVYNAFDEEKAFRHYPEPNENIIVFII